MGSINWTEKNESGISPHLAVSREELVVAIRIRICTPKVNRMIHEQLRDDYLIYTERGLLYGFWSRWWIGWSPASISEAF